MLLDSLGRQIKDLRISVTDRCNFKCFYCKSARGVNYVEREHLLTFEEIEHFASVLVRLGIRKIRLTGGEPLLRKNLECLISRLSGLPELEDLAITTNAFNLSKRAGQLVRAGLGRVTVSLDSLRPDRFFEMTRYRDFENILEGIRSAKRAGLEPVKINCVVVRDVNDDEIVEFGRFALEEGLAVRFIEFMPIDEDEKWSFEQVVKGEEVLKTLIDEFELVPLESVDSSATAKNYGFKDSSGSVGVITPVSRPFCGECSRLRLTADGKLRTCLFSMVEHDVKALLRNEVSTDELEQFVREIVFRKEEGHRINEPDFKAPPRTMSYIGG